MDIFGFGSAYIFSLFSRKQERRQKAERQIRPQQQ